MQVQTMKLSELVFDFDFYPRSTVDSSHVAQMAEAVRCGADLPAIVACAKTKRVVDGFHRGRATRQVHGDDAEIDVKLKDYDSDAAFLLDAIRYNAQHGKPMSNFDRARCALLADKLHVDDDAVAEALMMSPERFDKLRLAKTARASTNKLIPIRRGMRHLAGKRLSKKQTRAAERVDGQWPIHHVQQLVELIEGDALPNDDERFMAKLKHLAHLLEGVLTEGAAA